MKYLVTIAEHSAVNVGYEVEAANEAEAEENWRSHGHEVERSDAYDVQELVVTVEVSQ